MADDAFDKSLEGKTVAELDAMIKAAGRTNAEMDKILKKWRQVTNEIEEAKNSVQDLTGKLQNMLRVNKESANIFSDMVSSFNPLNQQANKLYTSFKNILNPATAFWQLTSMSVKRFAELDDAAMSFRETTGFLASQTSQVETNVRMASRDLATFGVSAESANVAAQGLANAFGDTAIANKENIEYVSLMKENLGVATEDSVNLLQNFMGLGGMTSQVARETAGAAASLAKAAGVPFNKVMKEVADASDNVRSLIRGSVDGLIKGAIEAKRLGTSLEAVGRAAAGFLDFQSSVNDEMEASVLFGKDVNLQKARELSYAGDLKGLAKEQNRLLQEAGDVSKMDFFQRNGIAKALGMSVKEMDTMNAKQKEMNELRIKSPELYKQLTADLDTLDKTNETVTEKYQKELKSQQIANVQKKLMNDIQSILTEISEILLPIVKLFFAIIVPIIKIGVLLAKFLLAPFRMLNDFLDSSNDKFETTKKYIEKISEAFSYLSSLIDTTEGKIAGSAALIALMFTRLGASVKGVFTGGIDAAKGLFSTVKGLIKPGAIGGIVSDAATKVAATATSTAATSAADAATSAIPTVPTVPTVPPTSIPPGVPPTSIPPTPAVPPTATPTAGQNIKEFLTNLSDGIKSFKPLGEILKGLLGIAAAGPAFLVFITAIPGILLMAAVGAMAPLITLGFTALSTGIKMMDISAIGKGLLGIAALGLSIIPFAFAMTLFSGVSWTGVIAGAAALVIFAAAAFGLGALLAGPGAIIFGAGVIGIAALGVAMLPLAYAAKLAAEGFALMNDVDLINIGLGLSTLSGAVLKFGASMAAGGMSSFLGGGMILQLVALAAISPALNNASMALSSIGGTLQMFKDATVVEGIENITEAIKGLNAEINNVNLLNISGLALLGNTAKSAAGTAGGGGGDEVVAKLDELIGLMRSGGIAVNIDGSKASTLLGVATRFKGASGIS